MEMNYVIYSTADIRWGTQDNCAVDVAMFIIFPPKPFSLIRGLIKSGYHFDTEKSYDVGKWFKVRS